MGQTTQQRDDSRYRDNSGPSLLAKLMDKANAGALRPVRALVGCAYRQIRSPRFARAIAAYDRGADDAAFRLFRQLAEHGHADSQYHLGVMYSEGHGTARDDAKAMYWFARAAEQGELNAGFIHALRI